MDKIELIFSTVVVFIIFVLFIKTSFTLSIFFTLFYASLSLAIVIGTCHYGYLALLKMSNLVWNLTKK